MVETLKVLIHDYIFHLDASLGQLIHTYGAWVYAILFVIVFCETGLVITPFLPGDSLLFAAGTFVHRGDLDGPLLFTLLSLAAILGDTVNYWIGAAIGPRAFTGEVRFLKREYLERAQRFYERHGGKAIILARFVPIIRTFAPFVAGIGTMNYRRFIIYNIMGGVAWVGLFLGGGCLFAEQAWVQHRFHYVIAAIILISLLPILLEYLRARRQAAHRSPLPPGEG
jgi:membrane-associated protein